MSENNFQLSLINHGQNDNVQHYLSVTKTDPRNVLFDLNTATLKIKKMLVNTERSSKCYHTLKHTLKVCQFLGIALIPLSSLVIISFFIFNSQAVKELSNADKIASELQKNNCAKTPWIWGNENINLICGKARHEYLNNNAICDQLANEFCALKSATATLYIITWLLLTICLLSITGLFCQLSFYSARNVCKDEETNGTRNNRFYKALSSKKNIILLNKISQYRITKRSLNTINPQQLVNFLATLNILNEKINCSNNNQQINTVITQKRLPWKNTITQIALYEMKDLLKLIIEYCGDDNTI